MYGYSIGTLQVKTRRCGRDNKHTAAAAADVDGDDDGEHELSAWLKMNRVAGEEVHANMRDISYRSRF